MAFEQPLIRPPSRWRSGLIRVTRGCRWNRCEICGIYPVSANSPGSPLLPEIESGNFTPQTAEGTVLELQLLLRHLTVEGPILTCDHTNNYISVRGMLPQDRPSMLETIDAFLSQLAAVRERHYQEIYPTM